MVRRGFAVAVLAAMFTVGPSVSTVVADDRVRAVEESIALGYQAWPTLAAACPHVSWRTFTTQDKAELIDLYGFLPGGVAWLDTCTIGIDYADTFARPWPTVCNTVVHEMGHLAGQDHSSDFTNVMEPGDTGHHPLCGPLSPAVADMLLEQWGSEHLMVRRERLWARRHCKGRFPRNDQRRAICLQRQTRSLRRRVLVTRAKRRAIERTLELGRITDPSAYV